MGMIEFGTMTGPHYTPHMTEGENQVMLSFTNDGDLPNPAPVNVKGAKGDKGDKGDDGVVSPEDLARISALESGKVDKIAGKGLSTNDYTQAEKDKLSGIAANATANAPATAAPLMDGAAAVGASAKYAREDHRHPVDTSRAAAADVSKILAYLENMEVYRTASGNPATFADGKAASLKDVVVTITPTQSGSGDPSPDNVRPISGVSSVTITRTGEGGANSQSVTVTLTDGANPLTVYGGTLDVTTGELSVAWAKYPLKNFYSAGVRNAKGLYRYRRAAGDLPMGAASEDILCEAAPSAGAGTAWGSEIPCVCVYNGEVQLYSDVPYENIGGLAAKYGDAGAVYKLATPLTYSLTPQQLAALAGYNSVSANAGTLSVTYLSDPEIALGGGV